MVDEMSENHGSRAVALKLPDVGFHLNMHTEKIAITADQ